MPGGLGSADDQRPCCLLARWLRSRVTVSPSRRSREGRKWQLLSGPGSSESNDLSQVDQLEPCGSVTFGVCLSTRQNGAIVRRKEDFSSVRYAVGGRLLALVVEVPRT